MEIFVDVTLDAKKLYYRDKDYFKSWAVHVQDVHHMPCIECKYSSKDWRTDLDGALNLIERGKNEEAFINSMMRINDDKESDRIISERLFLQSEDTLTFLQSDNSFKEITEQLKNLNTNHTYIPLSLLVDGLNNFRKKGNVLFTLTNKIDGSDVEFQIKLATDTANKSFSELIEDFCSCDPKVVQNEQFRLETDGIIRRINTGSYHILKHGPDSFGGMRLREQAQKQQQKNLEEQSQESRQNEQQEKITQVARISLIKKAFAIGLPFAAILGYFLYYKFYTTN